MATFQGKSGTYHHGDLRAALLRAATEIIEADGTGSLSLRETARRAGVSQTAPYRHFADKSALLAGVAVEGFHALTDALAAAAQTDGRDRAARLQALGSAYVGFALGHPGRLRLMFGPELAGWLQRDPALRAAAQETSTVLARAVREVIGDDGDATIGTLAVWSLMHGLAHLILDVDIAPNRMGGAAMDKLVHQVIGVLARGLELSPVAELSGDAPASMAAPPEPQRAVGD